MNPHDDSFGSLLRHPLCSADILNGSIAIAIMHNCTLDVLQHLIDKGYSVNAKWLKKEPLYYAIQLDRKDLWERLVTAGADCTGMFHRCCGRLDKPKIVERMLSKYPDLVDTKDCYGNSALHIVACYGNIETACLLVSYGVDTTVLDEFGRTALEYIHYQKIQEGYDDRTTTRVRMGMDQIIRLLSEEQGAYLVYKGFAIYDEIKFNHGDTTVKEVLEFVWSRSNYDVFGEQMGYLT